MKDFDLKYAVLNVIVFFILFSGCRSPEKGMILYSDFETGASDLSGNGYDGVCHGAALSDDAAVGGHSLYFDGVDDYVEYPSDIVYFRGAYTISIWVKWRECRLWNRILDFNQDAPMSGNAVTFLIGALGPGMEGLDLWFDQWVMSEGAPVESIVDQFSRPGEASLGYTVQTGKWDHYAIVYQPDADTPIGSVRNGKGLTVPYRGKVTFYLNGVKHSQSYRCLEPQNVPTRANWLGRSRFAEDPYFNGWMDDFRIYGRSLSDEEIMQLYNINDL